MHGKLTDCSLLTVLVLLIVGIHPGISGLAIKATCTESYSPCTCAQNGVDLFITCAGAHPAQIKEAFGRTSSPVLKEVEILLPADAGTLPSDILSGKVADYIRIRGSGRDSFQLTIDISAFAKSKTKTTLFEISDADLNLLSFDFLDGFAYLTNLYLTRVSGIRTIKGIKLLQSLTGLYIDGCMGFAEVSEFPFGSYPSLRGLHLINSQDLSDDKLAMIMTALDASPVGDTLTELYLDANRLTRVPMRVLYLANLKVFSIESNDIEYLQVDSVRSNKTTFFSLGNNKLTNIEPGAFVGDYSETKVYLALNRLTYLYEAVYKPLLQSMYDANNGGLLLIHDNPFICDCTMAWLIVQNRNLLQKIHDRARCSNGKFFIDLNPNDFAVCSV